MLQVQNQHCHHELKSLEHQLSSKLPQIFCHSKRKVNNATESTMLEGNWQVLISKVSTHRLVGGYKLVKFTGFSFGSVIRDAGAVLPNQFSFNCFLFLN